MENFNCEINNVEKDVSELYAKQRVSNSPHSVYDLYTERDENGLKIKRDPYIWGLITKMEWLIDEENDYDTRFLAAKYQYILSTLKTREEVKSQLNDEMFYDCIKKLFKTDPTFRFFRRRQEDALSSAIEVDANFFKDYQFLFEK